MVPEFGAFDAKTPSPQDVYLFHNNSDRDSSPFAQHHTLGSKPNQAAPGNHKHDSYTTHDAGDIVWSISPNLKPGWAWPDGQREIMSPICWRNSRRNLMNLRIKYLKNKT